MQQIPWFRTVPWLRVAVGVWTVLFALDLSLLIVDPSRWAQHGLQLLLPIVFGLMSAQQLRAALRRRRGASEPGERPHEQTER